jgi:hypothetical protein
MARATLLLDVDTTPARSALGDLRGSARSAQASLTAEARKGERDRERVMRDEARAAQRVAAEAARTRSRLERESTKATERAERERTKATKEEASKRLKAERDEARDRKREIDKTARDAEKAEKERTRTAKTEANKRVKAEERAMRQQLSIATRRSRELGGRVATGVGTAARAVYGGAVAMHGQFQDARERRAAGERTLGNAVRNANPNASSQEQAAARDAVRQFVVTTGMNFGDVANALMEGQAHGSTLQAEGGETTAQAIQRSLAMIREANAEGADPGQYLAARGRLAANGLSGDALKTAMRFSLAAAQAGQVEVDQIIGAGLPGASRLMASRVGALSRGTGETDEAFEARRQQTRLDAWRESVSTQEVLAASGGNAGHTSNTLASLQNFINTPRRQEMALTNIKAAEAQVNTATPEGRARAAQLRSLYEGDNALFERDPTRTGNAMRLRGGVSAAEFATRVTTATGGNAQMGANIFAGGGHGNAQALLAPMRSLMAVLGGEQGQRIQTMMQGSGVTDAQIANHQRDVEGDSLSTLTRAQEQRDNALTDNTSRLKNLSDAIHDWQVRNPIAKTALDSAGGVVGSIGGAFALQAVKNTAAKAILPGAVNAATGGAAAAGASALPVAGAVLATAGAAALSLRTAITGTDLSGREVGGLRRAEAAAGTILTPLAVGEIGQQIGAFIVNSLRSQPLTAEVPIAADIHARAAGTR